MEWLKSWWYNLKSGWRDFSPYSRWDVERHARLDGSLERPVPQVEDLGAPWYLGAMKEHFDNIVRGIGGSYQEEDAPLHNREVLLEAQRTDADQEFRQAESVYQKACEYFEQHNPGIPPQTQQKRTIAYWTVSLLLFLLEFPMNFEAFKIFGDDANLLTALTAFMVGGILLGSAHFMGIEWRKGPFNNRQSLSVFLTTLAMPVLAVFGVASLRSLHFSQQSEGDVARMPVTLLFGSFAVFNLGIYLVASLLSRWAHPVGAEQVLEARKRLRLAQSVLAQIRVEWEGLRNAREVLHAKYATEAHRVTDQHMELTKRYLMENTRARKGETIPGANGLPHFLAELNMSLRVSLPWMISRRPSDRDPALTFVHEDLSGSEEPDHAVSGGLTKC